jgi:hypothetical protein
MQRLTIVRYTTKPEATAENERLSKAVFDEVRHNEPAGVAYALFRHGDEFVHLFVNLSEASSDAVTGLVSFERYQEGIRERCITPPEPLRLQMDLIESYGFTGR